MAAWIAGLAGLYLGLGAVLHRLYLLLRPPPERLFPGPGAVLRSESEGFTQHVLAVEGEQVWVRLTLDPHAAGPPEHVHARFAERFHVASGSVQVELEGGSRTLGAGEELLVPPGARHRLWNPSTAAAVVDGPQDAAHALPRRFGLFLTQAYGLFDEAPERARPPRALLQMSFWSPLFDVWLPGPPLVAQRLLFALVRPLAFALGYRPWYGRFAPRAAAPVSRPQP